MSGEDNLLKLVEAEDPERGSFPPGDADRVRLAGGDPPRGILPVHRGIRKPRRRGRIGEVSFVDVRKDHPRQKGGQHPSLAGGPGTD